MHVDLSAFLQSLRHGNGRHSVFLVTTPETFRPVLSNEIPDTFSEPRLYVRCGSCESSHVVRLFNEQQLELGLPDRLWAIAVMRPRNKKLKSKAALCGEGRVGQ